MTALQVDAWGLSVAIAAAGGGAAIVLVLDTAFGRADAAARAGRRRDLLLTLVSTIALLSAAVAAASVLVTGGAGPGTDAMTALPAVSVVGLALAGVVATWLSSTYLMALRLPAGPYLALFLLSLAGAFVAVTARHALALFVGAELLAVPAYFLAGWDRDRARSNEAGLKAFVLGALASALLLYGLALLYGETGRLDHAGLGEALATRGALGSIGLGLVLVGLLTKAGLAPFHAWVPDVDEGAPSSATAVLAVCVRGAFLLVLLRVVVDVLPPEDLALRHVFAGLAVIGVVVGSAMAMVQRNVKRLLAWGSVAHGGTMVLAFATGGADAYGALLFYWIAHAVATLGALGVVVSLAAGGRDLERLEDFAGIGRARPGLSALMTLFLMGLAGLPGTAGFWARLLLLRPVVAEGHLVLATVAALGAVVLVYAYMRVPTMLYMREAPEPETSEASTSELAILLVCAALTVYLGVWPDPALPGLSGGLLELLRAASLSPS
jgi:NADH-quinone oxidoreductase subunit N